jgi:glycerate kinase
MKILIVPDSFKGTLSSQEVCDCISEGLLEVDKNADITAIPFSDGGEGFGKCYANSCKGELLYTSCTDIYSKIIKAPFYACGDTAVIECASASGLQRKKDVMNATSYGTGELIKTAVSKGFSKIILGLGGTGCCDGGAGALSALGAVFRTLDGEIIDAPRGKDLTNIYGAGFSNIVKDISFTYACDVDNVYFGKSGASYVFAKQKGANTDEVKELDYGLQMLNAFLPRDVSRLKGAGSAGGICGGLYSVYGGKIKSGFDILSDAYSLEEKIKSADLVISGEGKTDTQTLMGKLPFKISTLAKKHNTKCVIISGKIDGVTLGDSMISLVDSDISEKQAIDNAHQILKIKSKLILQ